MRRPSDLCLAVFPWASFRRTTASIKLHIGLDQAGHRRASSEGKTGDVKAQSAPGRFAAGSVVVADRAYLDFKWFHQLQARGVTFVTRLKRACDIGSRASMTSDPEPASSAIRRSS